MEMKAPFVAQHIVEAECCVQKPDYLAMAGRISRIVLFLQAGWAKQQWVSLVLLIAALEIA
jgi:hypothetical protein